MMKNNYRVMVRMQEDEMNIIEIGKDVVQMSSLNAFITSSSVAAALEAINKSGTIEQKERAAALLKKIKEGGKV